MVCVTDVSVSGSVDTRNIQLDGCMKLTCLRRPGVDGAGDARSLQTNIYMPDKQHAALFKLAYPAKHKRTKVLSVGHALCWGAALTYIRVLPWLCAGQEEVRNDKTCGGVWAAARSAAAAGAQAKSMDNDGHINGVCTCLVGGPGV